MKAFYKPRCLMQLNRKQHFVSVTSFVRSLMLLIAIGGLHGCSGGGESSDPPPPAATFENSCTSQNIVRVQIRNVTSPVALQMVVNGSLLPGGLIAQPGGGVSGYFEYGAGVTITLGAQRVDNKASVGSTSIPGQFACGSRTINF